MSTRRLSRCFGILVFLGVATQTLAQTPAYPGQPVVAAPAGARPTAARVMRASRAKSSISIDGKLTEPAWGQAVPSGDFMQSYPQVGGKPTDPTEVRILYDDDA